jgi:hypothetical protein
MLVGTPGFVTGGVVVVVVVVVVVGGRPVVVVVVGGRPVVVVVGGRPVVVVLVVLVVVVLVLPVASVVFVVLLVEVPLIPVPVVPVSEPPVNFVPPLEDCVGSTEDCCPASADTFTATAAVSDPAWALIVVLPAPMAVTTSLATPATLESVLLQATPSRAALGAGVPLLIVPDKVSVAVSPTVSERRVGETANVSKVMGAAWSLDWRNAAWAALWSLARLASRADHDPVVLPMSTL